MANGSVGCLVGGSIGWLKSKTLNCKSNGEFSTRNYSVHTSERPCRGPSRCIESQPEPFCTLRQSGSQMGEIGCWQPKLSCRKTSTFAEWKLCYFYFRFAVLIKKFHAKTPRSRSLTKTLYNSAPECHLCWNGNWQTLVSCLPTSHILSITTQRRRMTAVKPGPPWGLFA